MYVWRINFVWGFWKQDPPPTTHDPPPTTHDPRATYPRPTTPRPTTHDHQPTTHLPTPFSLTRLNQVLYYCTTQSCLRGESIATETTESKVSMSQMSQES